jgi:hypothetical protein
MLRDYHQSMRRSAKQGENGHLANMIQRTLFLAMVGILFSLAGSANAAPSPDGDTSPSARKQLDDACDLLRRFAIRSPYGWGWSSDAASTRVDPTDRSKAVKATSSNRKGPAPDIDVRVTAAAGLMLHLAGKELNSRSNAEVAIEAARAIASVQLPTGQIPASGRLLPKPAGHAENVGIVPDRAPTCAALGLMLTLIEANPDKPDARIVSSATRAATWLARQQTANGGWQTAYPEGLGPKARRLIRLDSSSYRDSTFALILASRVLARQEYSLAADRSIDQLLRLRLNDDGGIGQGLWGPAYNLGGDAVRDIDELPYGVDSLATRLAVETLLGARLVAARANLTKELLAAAKAIETLPKEKGQWQPRYDPFPRNDPPPAPSKEVEVISGDDSDQEITFDSAALSRVVHAASQSQTETIEIFAKSLWKDFGPTERLAQTVTGLSDTGLTLAAAATEKSPTGSLVDLPTPVTKAWTYLQKAKSDAPDPAAKK